MIQLQDPSTQNTKTDEKIRDLSDFQHFCNWLLSGWLTLELRILSHRKPKLQDLVSYHRVQIENIASRDQLLPPVFGLELKIHTCTHHLVFARQKWFGTRVWNVKVTGKLFYSFVVQSSINSKIFSSLKVLIRVQNRKTKTQTGSSTSLSSVRGLKRQKGRP